MAQSLTPIAQQKKLHFETELDPPDFVTPQRSQEGLSNPAQPDDNALKFTEKGSVRIVTRQKRMP